MEPEVVLGLCLLALLALGLGTQLARTGSYQHVLLLALGVVSLFAMVGWQQFLTEQTAQWVALRGQGRGSMVTID